MEWLASREKALAIIAGLLKSAPEKAAEKVEQLLDKTRNLEKQLEKLQAQLASSAGNDLVSQAIEVAGVKILAVKLDQVDPKALRDLADQLKNKLGSSALVLAAVEGDKVSLVASVSKDQMGKIKAGRFSQFCRNQSWRQRRRQARYGDGGWQRPIRFGRSIGSSSGLDKSPDNIIL